MNRLAVRDSHFCSLRTNYPGPRLRTSEDCTAEREIGDNQKHSCGKQAASGNAYVFRGFSVASEVNGMNGQPEAHLERSMHPE